MRSPGTGVKWHIIPRREPTYPGGPTAFGPGHSAYVEPRVSLKHLNSSTVVPLLRHPLQATGTSPSLASGATAPHLHGAPGQPENDVVRVFDSDEAERGYRQLVSKGIPPHEAESMIRPHVKVDATRHRAGAA